MIWLLMLTFVIRLAGGLALAMLFVPSRLVISGFFRVHLWVALGLFTFAALITNSLPGRPALIPAILGGVLSYVGAVIWLYEKPHWGWWSLGWVVGCAVWAIAQLTPGNLWTTNGVQWSVVVRWLEHASSAALLGIVLCAMLLGHWYLNTPTMQLLPLQRLTWMLFVAILFRASVATLSVWMGGKLPEDALTWALFGLQWLAGLLGMAVVTVMTWETLKIPNTQSATGILYVGVILAFLGEMATLVPAS